MSLTFKTLRDANASRAERWRKGQPELPLTFAMTELAGEGGEVIEALLRMTVAIGKACNEAKKLERGERGLAGGKTDMLDFQSEMADVVICADLVALRAKFDLAEAVARKFNKTSEKHGFPERLVLASYTRDGFAVKSGDMVWVIREDVIRMAEVRDIDGVMQAVSMLPGGNVHFPVGESYNSVGNAERAQMGF